MRGLTPEEREMLEYAIRASRWPCVGLRAHITDRDDEVLAALAMQGRTTRAPCSCHGLSVTRPTPAGREALAIDTALRAMGVAL